MEQRRWARLRPAWPRWLFAVAALMCASWVTRTVWDYQMLTGSAAFARLQAVDGTDEAKCGAAAILLRDTRRNLDALRSIAASGGAAGPLAQTALQQLQQESR